MASVPKRPVKRTRVTEAAPPALLPPVGEEEEEEEEEPSLLDQLSQGVQKMAQVKKTSKKKKVVAPPPPPSSSAGELPLITAVPAESVGQLATAESEPNFAREMQSRMIKLKQFTRQLEIYHRRAEEKLAFEREREAHYHSSSPGQDGYEEPPPPPSPPTNWEDE